MEWKTLVMPLARLYWRVFRPKTFGVKALIVHPDKKRVLLVLHSYGNKHLWNLPGGGYSPRRENPLTAARREVLEELGVHFLNARELCLYQTNTEGKRDTVTVVVGEVNANTFILGDEISKVQWMEIESVVINESVARVARYALRQLTNL